MSAALYDQLADELGISAEDAEAALDGYLDDVRAQVEAGETVTIPGLGTLAMEDGEFDFTASEPLQEAVNYRNTHLAPLTVSEAPEPPPDEEDEPAADEPQPTDTEEEPAADESEEAVPDLSDDWAAEVADEPAPPPSSEPEPDQHATDEGPTRGQVAGLIASVVLLFVALGYVATTQGWLPGLGPASEQPASSPSPLPDTSAVAATPDTADTTAPAEPEEDPAPATAPQSIDRATGGWTIVVGSRTQPGEAKALLNTYQQRFRGEGLPTDILTGESGGQLRYRVAVGQYDSREAALTARQQLQGRIPDDAWPLQIQPGS